MSYNYKEIEIEENINLKEDVFSTALDYIPILDGDTSYKHFFENHLLINSPCILKNVSSSWECTKKWICNEDINFDYLINEYGHLEAPVADCDTLTYNAHCKRDMKVKEYMNYIRNPKTQRLYLKDWHLKKIQPHDSFYEVPDFFASDWLNEYALDQKEDDFMFVYIGPSGSWTPLHADVYSSHSWSVNVIGLKKWVLFPPGEEDKLKDSLGNLPLQFSPENYENITYYEINQEKGDAIFVPSGWHHQVTNLRDTISINHNWMNGCNVHIVWKALEDNLKLVEQEIEEFKMTPEFNNQCQLILKSSFGMDYQTFVTLLLYIAEKRLSQLRGHILLNFDKYIYGNNCIKFDLKSILNVFNIIINKIDYYEKFLIPSIKDNLYNLHSTINMII